MKKTKFDKKKYILVGLVLCLIVLLLILGTAQFNNIIELKGDDLTYCKELRAELYADYSVNKRAFDEDDRIVLYDYKDTLAKKYNIKSEKYLLDLQTCVFILKSEVKKGVLKEYRNAKGPI